MNRARATYELIKKDRVTTPGQEDNFGRVQDVAVKVHDGFANVLQTLISPISKNEYAVVNRDSPVAGTREAIRSTIHARWFEKGNPLNVIPKVAEGAMSFPDALVSDALHIGDDGNGKVIKTVPDYSTAA